MFFGDQGDPKFWETVTKKLPSKLDIFLDDGGHTMTQQRNTVQAMFPQVKNTGIYLCEDLSSVYRFVGVWQQESGKDHGLRTVQ